MLSSIYALFGVVYSLPFLLTQLIITCDIFVGVSMEIFREFILQGQEVLHRSSRSETVRKRLRLGAVSSIAASTICDTAAFTVCNTAAFTVWVLLPVCVYILVGVLLVLFVLSLSAICVCENASQHYFSILDVLWQLKPERQAAVLTATELSLISDCQLFWRANVLTRAASTSWFISYKFNWSVNYCLPLGLASL